MLGHGAIGQFAIGEAAAITTEVVTVDKWFVPFSDPVVRVKRGLAAANQLAYPALNPRPFVPFDWFYPFSDPIVRTKRGLKAALQQALSAPARLLPNPTL